MLEAYMSLPAWLRTVVAVAMLGAGIAITLAGYTGRPKTTERLLPNGRVEVTTTEEPGARGAFRFGFFLTGIGAILLLTCGKSNSEKNGYNF